mmetsp:Transcript_19521/g.49095  ORF Transcript_19521/g.49095 Transcript_19521/m.49095 type:complete len:113 (-) Transcript_19521:24-362(-)
MRVGTRKPAVGGGFDSDPGSTDAGGGGGAAAAAASVSSATAAPGGSRLEITAVDMTVPMVCMPDEPLLSNAKHASPSLNARHPCSIDAAGETIMRVLGGRGDAPQRKFVAYT